MMNAAHLQQSYPHPGMNGQDERSRIQQQQQQGGPASLLAGGQHPDGRKKRFWPPKKPKSNDSLLTLEEAAKQELAAVPTKTPVSILQELLSRRGTTPTYELVQIEGAIHEPTFRYRVTVGDVFALGFGRSKKEAKHAAAKNVLDKIVGNPVNEEAPVIEQEVKVEPQADNGDKIPGNPIGTLQELCMSRRWPPPLYSLNAEEGLPHERNFTITCIVNKSKETGTGKSKKLAKRQAAHKMWELLQNSAVADDEEAALARYAGVRACKIPTLTAPNTHKVSAFHKSLKTRRGRRLEQLQTEDLGITGFNYVQFLQEISQEQHFEVTYVDVEEPAKNGKFQCLVQLSTMPVAVCYGCGASSKEAQSAAAYNALEYLKIMTKK